MKFMIKKLLFSFFLLMIYSNLLLSEDRGLEIKVKELGGRYSVVGKQYAIFIAINRYQHWMSLKNPLKDAQEIREILVRRYYIDEVIELYNKDATKAGIIKLFSSLIQITQPEDSVFIFYAGHGYLDEMSDTGFWIPYDGGKDIYAQDNWLANNQIRGFIKKMKARHIALVSDSCFSGDILNPSRGLVSGITDEYFQNAYNRVSRQVLTSGASETVPDVSPFAQQLKLALEGNNRPYLDPLILYNEIRLGVLDTMPLFGELKGSGHQDGASFILFLKDEAADVQEIAISTTEEPELRITLEKTYGSLEVEAQTSGDLYIDGRYQGKLPVGSIAKIENLETGKHEIAMHYYNRESEIKTADVIKDDVALVAFSYVEPRVELSEPAKIDEPSAKKESPKPESLSKVPLASIKINGKFDDWSDIRPMFVDTVGDKLGLQPDEGRDIEKVYLARDSKYIYVKFDVADGKLNSLREPTYDVVIKINQGVDILLKTYYNKYQHKWISMIGKWEKDTEDWSQIGTGSHRRKGSSFEARFRLLLINKYVQMGLSYKINANIGYHDKGKYIHVDNTQERTIQF
jgi:hypothetical protein